jgi:hypothetical protein
VCTGWLLDFMAAPPLRTLGVYHLQKDFERRADPNDRNAQVLLDEMRQHIKKVGASRAPACVGTFP